MTVNEFIKYYELGHGRAIIELKDEEDKTPFRTAFLEFIKNNKLLPFRLDYDLMIYNLLSDGEFKTEAENILAEKIRSGSDVNAVDLLMEFGQKEIAAAYLEELYDNSYKRMVSCLTTNDYEESAEYASACSNYFCACVDKEHFFGFDDKSIEKIIIDNVNLLEISENAEIPASYTPLWQIKDSRRNDGTHFEELFDKTLKGHKYYEKLRSVVFRVCEYPEKKQFKTACDFINYDINDFEDALNDFCNADEATVRIVAQKAIDETDLERKIAILSLFEQGACGFSNVPLFPLSEECLIDYVDKYKNEPWGGDTLSPEAELAYCALCVLVAVKSQKAKECCLDILNDKKLHPILRANAFHTLNNNYSSDDSELVKDIYYNCEFSMHEAVTVLLSKLAEKGEKNAPYELLWDAYEKLYFIGRSLAVQGLIKSGLINAETLNECLYDSCTEIREMAREECGSRTNIVGTDILDFDMVHFSVESLSKDVSLKLRRKFIDLYVDVDDEKYIKYIRPVGSDDIWYGYGYIVSYLHACLKEEYRRKITLLSVLEQLKGMKNKCLFVMHDVRPKAHYYPDSCPIIAEPFTKYFSSDIVLKLTADKLLEILSHDLECDFKKRYFGEDLYVFDETLGWFIALTHDCFSDENEIERICYCGNV